MGEAGHELGQQYYTLDGWRVGCQGGQEKQIWQDTRARRGGLHAMLGRGLYLLGPGEPDRLFI